MANKRVNKETALEGLRKFREEYDNYTYANYDNKFNDSGEYPSASTLTNLFGNWTNVKKFIRGKPLIEDTFHFDEDTKERCHNCLLDIFPNSDKCFAYCDQSDPFLDSDGNCAAKITSPEEFEKMVFKMYRRENQKDAKTIVAKARRLKVNNG